MSAADDAAQHKEASQAVSVGSPIAKVDGATSTQRHTPDEQHGASDTDEESEEDEEPQLKYDKLTNRLTSLYRNGDSSSSLLVAGNKLVIGTHNGNVYVLDLITLQPLRTYQAHSATVTSCSVSPIPPPPTLVQRADGSGITHLPFAAKAPATKPTPAGPKGKTGATPAALPNTPDNAIFVATSSLDGHVCVFNLLDPKDVQLRNFARPVNSVALSPDYKSDKTYLSGGRAGQLILTKGGKAGVQADANTNSAAAAASGWLGSIGLGSNTGRDTILHQGEGNISTIKWSTSGKWIAWVNEEGIKIMRSHLKLGNEDSDNAWKRINYAAKPNRRIWEEMVGVWKARMQWVDDRALEHDPLDMLMPDKPSTATPKAKKVEKLIVGWGDTTWILHVREGGTSSSGKAQIGSADIVHKLQFRDCVIAGVSLYSPSLLAILAYRTKDENSKKASIPEKTNDAPRRGRTHKHTALAPQLRLIGVQDGEELDVDELPMNRFETLSAQDYDFESVWISPAIPERTAREGKGAMEGLWELSGGYYAQKMLSSGASVLSRSSSGFEDDKTRNGSRTNASIHDVTPTQTLEKSPAAHNFLLESGLKLFVSSPYDCVLAMRRQTTDHLEWLLQHEKYAEAWDLVDTQPEVVTTPSTDQMSIASGRTAHLPHQSLADFLGSEDNASIRSAHARSSAAASEKLRIGELWLAQLIKANEWTEAGQIAAQVLHGSSRWEHWVMTFARADHYEEITSAVPAKIVHPSVPSNAYETLLRHYILVSPTTARELVDRWEEGLFDGSAIVSAIRTRLADDEVKDGSEDWLALLDMQGQLFLTLANPQEALRCFIRTHNADRAFALLQDEKIADALSDNVTGFLTMRIAPSQLKDGVLPELDEASNHAVQILVEEAHKNTLSPDTVIRQLQQKGKNFRPFLYFYLRTLWHGVDQDRNNVVSRRMFSKTADEGHAMVEDYADLAVEVFAEYDREMLMQFLDSSEVYDYNRAVTICDERKYIPELVLVLSRTGQTKRALWLIIGELGDASQAIAFVKQHPDLWDDLLEYGMDKPKFVRGLLAEVGTSIDPVKLVQRVPTGLEIEGLKEGILNLVQGWEVQLEVSRGVERVLRGEVLGSMDTLRNGQRQGIRFEVIHDTVDEVEISVVPVDHKAQLEKKPGHCAGCDELFHEDEQQPLLGFVCGHVYHLSCILNTKDRDSAVYDNIMSSLGYGEEEPSYNTRSVGPKVTHAEIIRRAVNYGCQHCRSAS